MISSADKGNSILVLPTQHYEAKIQDFIDKNNFQISPSNPTKTFQNQIRKTINHSPTLIPSDLKWKFINLNPSAPTLKGLIKLHKTDQLIRPVVNWRNAPAYKLSKLFTPKINHLIPLSNPFNITNSTELIRQLLKTPNHIYFDICFPRHFQNVFKYSYHINQKHFERYHITQTR